jgi:archaellum component FlaF (FlaF/FlaG flagellin family)
VVILGFSTVAAYMIFFFAVIMLVGSIVTIYSNMVESSTVAYSVEQERIEQISHTRIAMDPPSYAPGTLNVNVTSIGNNKLRTEFIDLYVDGIKIPRNDLNRTISFAPDSTVVNPLLWDPYETLEIKIFIDLAAGQHDVAVTTEFGVVAERAFTT